MSMIWRRDQTQGELYWTLPSLIWLFLLFCLPCCIILAYAFKSVDAYGGIQEGWTFKTLQVLSQPHYYALIWRTIWLSTLTTVISLIIALPVGYELAVAPAPWGQRLLLLIIVPFWTSFLIRIFAWKTLLHPEGAFKWLLVQLHLLDPQQTLLYNSGAVLFVMVYTYLPFALFSIYAASTKFNFQLMEGAMDLGATWWQAFFKIFLPCIHKGILNAMIMVFIPAVGAYVIPDLVGGTNNEMIGNKIVEKTLLERNLPEASLLSMALAFMVTLAMLIFHRLPLLLLWITGKVRGLIKS